VSRVVARIPGAQGFGRHNPSIGGMLSLGIMEQNRKAGGNNVCVFTDEFGVKQTPCDGGGGFGCPCVQMLIVDNPSGIPTLGPFSATGGITGEVISVLTISQDDTYGLLVTLDNCVPIDPIPFPVPLIQGPPNTWAASVDGAVPQAGLSTSPPCPCLQIFVVVDNGLAVVDGYEVALGTTLIGTVIGSSILSNNILVLMMLPPGVPCESGSGVTTATDQVRINEFPYNVFNFTTTPPPVQLQGSGGGSNGNAACCSCQGPKAYCPNCWERKTRFTLSTK